MRADTVLGTEFPIVQAPMAGAQGSALAIAVSNAGGLGSLPCATLSIDAMRAELALVSANTSNPYNVNFFCHAPPVRDAEREARWRKLLAPYYAELGLDVNEIVDAPARASFNDDMASVLAEFKPPVVSFHFGLPSPSLLQRVKEWGATVVSSATTVREARWLEQHGADVIIAQGVEAGGHRGMFLTNDTTTQVGTFALLPQVVQAVRVPVLAAGAITNAREVRAAMQLGASGVQIGTTFLLCPETKTNAVYRSALKGEDAIHTAITNVFTGRPARGIVNRIVRELGPLNSAAPEFPLAANAVLPLRKAESMGNSDFSQLWCGQNATGCREIGAAELLRQLAAGI